jgi:hypothetical protein
VTSLPSLRAFDALHGTRIWLGLSGDGATAPMLNYNVKWHVRGGGLLLCRRWLGTRFA